jgi:hypothetical protein
MKGGRRRGRLRGVRAAAEMEKSELVSTSYGLGANQKMELAKPEPRESHKFQRKTSSRGYPTREGGRLP